MKVPANLVTPIYLKLDPTMPWPDQEGAFFLLTSDGLFLCRNHAFFRSSARVRNWPTELAGHNAFIKLNYPKVPRVMLERVVGFFSRIATLHNAEAAVLLAWNKTDARLEVIVPDQRSIVSQGWNGNVYPIELFYQTPPLPPNWILIGDIHSHVDGPAYSSFTDQDDEAHRPGLHIVVGRIRQEPPQFHIEATVDGTRFEVCNQETVLSGYERRRSEEVPPEWIDRVTVQRSMPVRFAYENEPRSGRDLLSGDYKLPPAPVGPNSHSKCLPPP